MLYLMKPNILLLLIKGGKRIQRQMMMSRLFAINRVHLADSVGIATKVFYFFLLLLFFVFSPSFLYLYRDQNKLL